MRYVKTLHYNKKQWFTELIGCSATCQHIKVNLCQLRGGKPAKDGQTRCNAQNLVFQDNNTTEFTVKYFSYIKRNNRLFNRMTHWPYYYVGAFANTKLYSTHPVWYNFTQWGCSLCHARTHVRQLTLAHAAKCSNTISWMLSSYFPMNWLQGNSMCIDRKQSTQLCPYYIGLKARKAKKNPTEINLSYKVD